MLLSAIIESIIIIIIKKRVYDLRQVGGKSNLKRLLQ